MVLVTAGALAASATALLERAECRVVCSTPYPQLTDLLELVREHRPAAILHRQGFINAAVMDAAGEGLRVVARHGAGVDGIDLDAARARKLTVTRAAGANSRPVAEHAWALLLSLYKDLHPISAGMRSGLWEKTSRQTRDVAGSTLGIVGYGAIGSKMAGYAEAFGMQVLAYDPYLPQPGLPGPGTRMDSLRDLLAAVDTVTLHCPLTAETRHLIGATELDALHRGALVVNAARGGIVDEAALLDALEAGHIAAAAVDVFETEPAPEESRLRDHPRVVATPHIAANTPYGAAAMADMAAACILDVLDGRVPSVPGAVVVLGRALMKDI